MLMDCAFYDLDLDIHDSLIANTVLDTNALSSKTDRMLIQGTIGLGSKYQVGQKIAQVFCKNPKELFGQSTTCHPRGVESYCSFQKLICSPSTVCVLR